MSDKDSKAPIIIAIVVAVVLIAAGGYYVLGGKITPPKVEPGNTPAATTKGTPSASVATPSKTTSAQQTPALSATTPAKVETIKCELCHKDAQNLAPHLNGGKLCVTCHGSQVHNIHIGPGTVGLECNTCHGSPPKIPTVDKSADGPGHFSVCENCHAAPPDSLKPSQGNLITVHLSRAKYCTNCHGTDIGVIHSAVLANASSK